MKQLLIAYFLLAALAANLPFMAERIFFVAKPSTGMKSLGWRLLELLLLYSVMLGIGVSLEQRFAPVHVKKVLDFYVPTLALFVIAAFPGFVMRYFWRKPGM